MATARLMETWAHSLDVHEGLGAPVDDTDRIRHVAHLGVRTRGFAFAVHGLDAPAEEFRVDLAAPSGDVWSWGPEDAAQTLTGSAGDFCRLVTQRRPPRRHRPRRHRRRRRPVARHRPGLRGPAGRGTEPEVTAPTSGVVRIGNCSGFYGDRLSAMREMLEGGELDVLTGDYLAELTMLILGKDQLKDPSLGYARTFVRQLEDCLGLALEKGVRIVANSGGLNPAGLADKVREVARGLGLHPQVAHVEGDDVRHLSSRTGRGTPSPPTPTSAASASPRRCTAGADVVVTGRVTDASLVVGPAVAHHGWTPTSYDELAGAVVAGHVIECGTQATGGNFSGFLDLPHRDRPLGFPVAEVAADGSSVITKHAGTGGAVTVDTVTAQLVYEIQSTRYLGPDVTVHLDSVRLEQEARGPRRDPRRHRRGPARAAQGVRQRARWLAQPGRARADRPRRRGQGGLGARAARAAAHGGRGDVVGGQRADRSTPTRRRLPPPCCAAP